MKTLELINKIKSTPARSAWSRGVRQYAVEIVEGLESETFNVGDDMLNGARNWKEYSEGGCALIYNVDIAERLCSPSELRKTRNGGRNPNIRETWLDCQARALAQASKIIERCAK